MLKENLSTTPTPVVTVFNFVSYLPPRVREFIAEKFAELKYLREEVEYLRRENAKLMQQKLN